MKRDPRVLVVEDEPAIAELISVNLRHDGFSPSWPRMATPPSASSTKSCPTSSCSIGCCPARAVSRWRGAGAPTRARNVPILMLTARGDEPDKIAGLDAGADDYLTKPFSPREMLARIRAILRRRAPEQSKERCVLGELLLDAGTHRVSFGETALKVGPTEFKILHFLMAHPERVHTRTQLLDKVWGDHVFIEERTVDVHMRRLRLAPGRCGPCT